MEDAAAVAEIAGLLGFSSAKKAALNLHGTCIGLA